MFVRITVPFNLLTEARRPRTSCQPLWDHQLLSQQGQSPSPHSPALLGHGPYWAGPIFVPTARPDLVQSPGNCLTLKLTSPHGDNSFFQPPGSSHPCSALICISLTVYLIACHHSWNSLFSCLRNSLYFKSFSFSLIFVYTGISLNLYLSFPTVYYRSSFFLMLQHKKS